MKVKVKCKVKVKFKVRSRSGLVEGLSIDVIFTIHSFTRAEKNQANRQGRIIRTKNIRNVHGSKWQSGFL